jgi:exopolysaccharide biosynthesis polyprenyl glycosylphosphotransferase
MHGPTRGRGASETAGASPLTPARPQASTRVEPAFPPNPRSRSAAPLGTATVPYPAPLPLGGRRARRLLGLDRSLMGVVAALDLVVPFAALALTDGLARGATGVAGGGPPIGPWHPLALLMAGAGVAAIGALGGYGPRESLHGARVRLAGRLILVGALCVWLTTVAGAGLATMPDLHQMAAMWAALPAGWLAGRWVVAVLRARRPERVLVLGSGRIARRVMQVSQRRGERTFRVVGCLDDDPLPMPEDGPPYLGRVDRLHDVLAGLDVDRVIVAFSARRDEATLQALRECDTFGVHVDVVPRLFDLLGPRAHAHDLGGLPLLSVRGSRRPGVGERAAKRVLDVAGAAVLGLLTAPLALTVALAIVIDSGRPVFYRQRRVGRDGRPFGIVKFRTMATDAERQSVPWIRGLTRGSVSIRHAVWAMKREGDARVTRVGRLLRATSLDELPQLWNILRGQMSLVGPRPLRPFEVDTLQGWQEARQSVKPGLTGLWQVEGRSKVAWDERMQLDYTYVRHWSLIDDLDILARTLPSVLNRRGAH